MEKLGLIEIRISGSNGNIELSPENFDISEIILILENAENLIYHEDKRNRPIISYKIEQGSVRHILKTSMQLIIAFNAIIGQINQEKNIDFLETSTAKAFENIQTIAAKKDYTFSLKTSLDNSNEITIDKNTHFKREESIWVDAEYYFYGKITNAGGKDKANLHVLTEDQGTVIIQTPVTFFETLNENIIHKKPYGVRATGKQRLDTGENDIKNLKFVELIEFEPNYDEKYLKKLRDKAKKSWLSKINPDNWLKEIRGGYDG